MTPYCTIHEAPMRNVLLGIVMDLPRYYKDKEATIINRKPAVGRARTPEAVAKQKKIMKIMQKQGKATTRELTVALKSNRFTTYQNCMVLQEEGKIQLVRVNANSFYWRVVS